MTFLEIMQKQIMVPSQIFDGETPKVEAIVIDTPRPKDITTTKEP